MDECSGEGLSMGEKFRQFSHTDPLYVKRLLATMRRHSTTVSMVALYPPLVEECLSIYRRNMSCIPEQGKNFKLHWRRVSIWDSDFVECSSKTSLSARSGTNKLIQSEEALDLVAEPWLRVGTSSVSACFGGAGVSSVSACSGRAGAV